MIVNLARLGKSGTGMWVYSINFVTALYQLNRLTGIICAEMHKEFFKKFGCKLIIVPDYVSNTSKVSRMRPIFWYIYSYYLSHRINKLANNELIVSTTHHFLPNLKKQVITIHDMRPYFFPDSRLQCIYFRKILPKKIIGIDNVITVSFSARNLISKTLNVPINNVSVIYNAINSDDFSHNHNSNTISNNDMDFFLAIGASWKHKNVHSFLENCDIWSEKYKFIIVCGRTAYVDELRKIVRQKGISDKVEFLHEVSFDKLKFLYSKAKALIYPSIDEGFGIPPIEAFASGTPAIVSDIPVFREILGSHAIYVDPAKKSDWASAINEVSLLNKADCDALIQHAKVYNLENMKRMVHEWVNFVDRD
jgi:glycosyltransferase involved in cell wall biosynthesis